MNPWLLVPTSIAAAYLLLMMLKLIFREIDAYHAANPRTDGGKRTWEKERC